MAEGKTTSCYVLTSRNGPMTYEMNTTSLKQYRDNDDDPKNFNIPIWKNVKIRICKPLIALKLALFVWYAAGSTVFMFLNVFFKQKGIAVMEMATVYTILPFVQFLCSPISGIIADKIGSAKPILIAMLLLDAIIMVGIILAPGMNIINCDRPPVNLECHDLDLISRTNCELLWNVTELTSCTATCAENISQYCNEENLTCYLLKRNESESKFSLHVRETEAHELKGSCYFNVTSISHRNITDPVCTGQHNMNCSISCLANPHYNCSNDNKGRTGKVFINGFLLILFRTTLSVTYRIMDVTAMALVEEHNSDFGRHRGFSMAGSFVFSIFSGYIVTASTTGQDKKNYKVGLYIFIGLIFVLFAIISKLKVQIKPPGKKMWKKSLYLLKKPDVISFALVLIILGSVFGFNSTFLFWYLEGLGTSIFQLGLINGSSSLYGLPFLFMSNWWIKKLGATQIFILGLLGYAIHGIGYSLLYEPWLSLLLQITDVLTYHLLWVTVVVHSHSLAPEGLTATIIAMAGGIHYNIGMGAGGFIGGLLMDAFGARVAFRVVAVTCLIAAILYAVYLYARKRRVAKC